MVDGTEQSWEKRDRVCWYRLQEPANAPISNPSFTSSFQVLASELWRGCLVQTWCMQAKSKVTINWGDIGVFASAAEKWWGLVLSPSYVYTIPNSAGFDGRELTRSFTWLKPTYLWVKVAIKKNHRIKARIKCFWKSEGFEAIITVLEVWPMHLKGMHLKVQ